MAEDMSVDGLMGGKKAVEVGLKMPISKGNKMTYAAQKDKDKDLRIGKGKDKEQGKKGKKLSKFSSPQTKLSRSQRAGVQFPVGRVHRFLKRYVPKGFRVGGTAGVYTASVMEYLAAEVLELAGNSAKDHKTKRITPRQITFAVRGDDELDALMKATLAGGGVIPNIDKSLLTNKSKKGKASKMPAQPAVPGPSQEYC